MKTTARLLAYGALLASVALAGVVTARAADLQLLNVSYDPTRELYCSTTTTRSPSIGSRARRRHRHQSIRSNGGSGKQAQAVIDGLDADVVTLALQGDIDAIAKKGLLDTDWREQVPEQVAALHLDHRVPGPQGQPQGHQGLAGPDQGRRAGDRAQPQDLGRRALGLSRGLGLAAKANNGDEAKATDFIKQLYQHVPVLDSGARGSTVTFAQKQIGDVELAWENEAYLVARRVRRRQFRDRLSAAVDPCRAAGRRGRQERRCARHPRCRRPNISTISTRPEGQTIAAKNHYRPIKPDLVTDKSLLDAFPKLDLVTIDDPIFGGWAKAQPKHFGDGGIFDQIYKPTK